MDRDESDLKGVAPRVWYEWAMLCWAFEQLGPYESFGSCDGPFLDDPADLRGTGSAIDEKVGSATIECFLLHARVLRDFLARPKSNHDDDVLAVHFFGNGAWTPPPVGETLKAEKERLDKALAHLSYLRIAYQANGLWDHHELFEELHEMWDHFWSALPEERREWFASDCDYYGREYGGCDDSESDEFEDGDAYACDD